MCDFQTANVSDIKRISHRQSRISGKTVNLKPSYRLPYGNNSYKSPNDFTHNSNEFSLPCHCVKPKWLDNLHSKFKCIGMKQPVHPTTLINSNRLKSVLNTCNLKTWTAGAENVRWRSARHRFYSMLGVQFVKCAKIVPLGTQ